MDHTQNHNTSSKKAILLNGRFPEFFEDGTRPLDIPECNPNNENNWMGWTKSQLEKHQFEVFCPIIPEVWKAPYSAWKHELGKCDVDSQTTMVGLSQGAGAITRYLSEEKKQIKKLILVAPMRIVNETGFEDFYDYEIPTEVQKQIQQGTTILFDPEDYTDVLKSVEILKKELDATLIQIPQHGHFSFKIHRLPELVDQILAVY